MSANYKKIFLAHDAVKKELLKIPEVVTVGIGLKEVHGQLTNQMAFRVYVKKKKALSEIPADHIIPKKIQGITTDVMTIFETEPLSTGATRPLVGGIHISSMFNESGLLMPSDGTLGCIAKLQGTNDQVMLSNEHVFTHTKTHFTPIKVYQPKYSKCLGFVCNEVGQTTNGKQENVSFDNGTITADYYIDCAIASIRDDINASNSITQFNSIAGSNDISALDLGSVSPYQVKKMGARTGLTNGLIEEIAFDEEVDPPETPQRRRIVVRPNPGKQWEETHEVRPEDKAATIALFDDTPVTVSDLGGNRLKFETKVFLLPGDSGSVLVNDSQEVVGLNFLMAVNRIRVLKDGDIEWAAIPLGKGLACHIGPVLEQMQIEIPAGTTPSSGTLFLTPGAGLKAEFSDDEVSLNDALTNLDQELRDSANGNLLVNILEDRLPEIIDLVHHRRPVKFTWHKYKGPAFINRLIHSIRYREKPLPKEIEGITIHTLLSKMDEVLIKQGSRELQRTLDQIRGFIYRLAGCHNMDEVVEEVMYKPLML